MKMTFDYILYSQSPALFLLAVLMLVCYFLRRRDHHVRAVLDLVLAILFAGLGIALYYLGMLHDVFTIHDFWQIRVPGWVGIGLVAVFAVYLLCRAFKRTSDKRKAEKNANRAENARRQEMEQIRQDAYASGMADAMSVGTKPLEDTAAADLAKEAAEPITLTMDPPPEA
jgi:Ca2+/Na+ antiporter